MKYSCTAIFGLISLLAFGQEKYIQQGSYWIRYYNQTQLTDNLTAHFHLDERRLVNPSRQFQLFIHTHINYRVKPWMEVAAGGNFNWTNSSVNESLRVPEWRPWQEVNLIKGFSRQLELQCRYRLDERFIHSNDRIELMEGYHFNLRHRVRIQLAYQLKLQDDSKTLLFRLSDEVMVNTGNVNDTFDQNRIYASIQYPLSKRLSFECGYLDQVQSRMSDDGYYDRHIIRLTLYHKVDFRKN